MHYSVQTVSRERHNKNISLRYQTARGKFIKQHSIPLKGIWD